MLSTMFGIEDTNVKKTDLVSTYFMEVYSSAGNREDK